jgi:general secretion pathway protein J
MTRPWQGMEPSRGFTLIELLVGIALMALMAAMSWRGLDGMAQAERQVRTYADEVLTLQASLAQWGADLDAMAEQTGQPSLDWDGRAMRILRRDPVAPGEGLRVVAWARRADGVAGHWLRWQSPPVRSRDALEQAWVTAAAWAQNAGDAERAGEVRIAPIDDWQIFYFRADAWSNPLSSAGASDGGGSESGTAAKGQAPAPVPEGVRLVLTLASGQAISGTITRDWLRPTVGGGK